MITIDVGNGPEIAAGLPQHWNILDVGGWAKPLRKANFVVDIEPYETRAAANPSEEQFDASTWYQIDFGGTKPFTLPFPDKFMDFVWCQQTLEDLTNPFPLIKEMQRVGKAGFIEVPSRKWESTIRVESEHWTGFCHHRWYCEISQGVNELELIFKHKSPMTMLSPFYQDGPPQLLGFVWHDDFPAKEVLLTNKEEIWRDVLEFSQWGFKDSLGVYPCP